MSCLHVKIKASRKDLHDMGICSEDTFKLLLSGMAMPVNKKIQENGKTLVFLGDPRDPVRDTILWVYEEFTEPV